MNGEDRNLSVVQSLRKLLLVLFAVSIVGGCMREEYVPFKPVYVVDEEYVISEAPVSAEFRQNIKAVLGFYDILYKEAEDGTILVPKRVWRDTDTMWNYTTKANDPKWLRQIH